MIEYTLGYTPGNKPSLTKTVTASSGEVFIFPLSPSNEEELENIDSSIMFGHIANLHDYMKEVFNRPESNVVGQNDLIGSEPWPIRNMGTFLAALQELSEWWNIAYYRDQGDQQAPVEESADA